MNRKLRWGIMSTANIAERSVIPGIHESEKNEVIAVGSRDLQKAKSFGERLNIPKAYGSYEQLLEDDEIDAVYIPLPNHLHKEWTIRAAQAGKHVLCEKPIALNAEEAREMIHACEEADVILAEAFMYRHQKRYSEIKERIRQGEIGEIRGIHGVFTFNNAAAKENIRFKKDWGGGSIYDVGCYPISAARLILEAEPVAVAAHAFFSPDHDDVDMMAAGVMEFPGDVALTFDCGMWAEGRNALEILGTEGRIVLNSAFVGDQSYQIIKNNEVETISDEQENPYKLQVDHFAEIVLDGKPLKFSYDDIIHNMKAVHATLLSAEKGEKIFIR